MTLATDYAVYFVLGHLAHTDGKRGLRGSVDVIEEAIASATERFNLSDEDQAHIRKAFNVRKAGDK